MSASGGNTESSPQFSALIVVWNETRHLEESLRSVRWCDEVVVVDLGGSSRARRIAEQRADRVLDHARVAVVEEVRAWAVGQLKHDWVVILDPDEVFPAAAVPGVRRLIAEDEACAAISIRFDYYFCRRRLNCCMWRKLWLDRIVHRARVRFAPRVHAPAELLGPRRRLADLDGWAVKHYWKDNLRELLESHRRYVRLEGPARYERSERFSWGRMARQTWRAFRYNFISTRGCRGGIPGWFLSFFMAWYEAASWFSLRRYERQALEPRAEARMAKS